MTLTDRLQVHFVELPKFLNQWKRGQLHPCEDRLARWLLLLEVSEDGAILTELEEIAMQQDPVLAEALMLQKGLADSRIADLTGLTLGRSLRNQVVKTHMKISLLLARSFLRLSLENYWIDNLHTY